MHISVLFFAGVLRRLTAGPFLETALACGNGRFSPITIGFQIVILHYRKVQWWSGWQHTFLKEQHIDEKIFIGRFPLMQPEGA
jgi:hypothetical protein